MTKEISSAEMTKGFPNVPRPISVIAADIRKNWPKVNYAAEPYLRAMACVNKLSDAYGVEDGRTQVVYFLGNATSWRGEDARRIKAELNAMLKAK